MTLTTWEEPVRLTVADMPVVEIRLPSLEELIDVWGAVMPMLGRATCRTGCYDPIDLLRLAISGQVGIWTCVVDGTVEAAVATEVKQYPRKRILEILFAGGGNMRAWLPALVATMDEHAKAAGCELVMSVGRKGWARAWGGKLTDHVIVREL